MFSIFIALVISYTIAEILLPFRERFSIETDYIVVKKGRWKERIALPDELLLVISWMSVPALIGDRDHFVKRKYALTLLEDMDPEELLKKLHQGLGFRYTNGSLEREFRYRWIYSFVLDREALREVMQGRKCRIALPESLREKLDLEGLDAEIYADVGY